MFGKMPLAFFVGLIIGLAVGGLLTGTITGFFVSRTQSGRIGELDQRYDLLKRDADRTITGLGTELERTRAALDQERSLNERARTIAAGAASTAERNIGNLQSAVGLIKEIRSQLKILADFYDHRDTNSSGN